MIPGCPLKIIIKYLFSISGNDEELKSRTKSKHPTDSEAYTKAEMFPGRGNALPKSSNRRMQSNHDPSTLLASAGVVENGYESVRNYQQNNRSPNHNKVNFDESSQFSPNKIKNLEKISSFSAAQKDAKSSRVVNKILTIRGEMKHKKLKCSASNSPILTPISATVSLEPLGKYLVCIVCFLYVYQ